MQITGYKSWVETLKPLFEAELHFSNTITCHTLDTSGTVWVKSILQVQCDDEFSMCVDIEPLTQIKNEDASITHTDTALIIKSGKTTVKSPKLVEPTITRRNKESINVTWPQVGFVLPIDDIKGIIAILNKTDKFSIKLNDHLLTVSNITNTKFNLSYEVECNIDGSFESKFYGTQLLDVMIAPKHFELCDVSLGTECPLMLHYNNEWLDVTYMLAPLQEPK